MSALALFWRRPYWLSDLYKPSRRDALPSTEIRLLRQKERSIRSVLSVWEDGLLTSCYPVIRSDDSKLEHEYRIK